MKSQNLNFTLRRLCPAWVQRRQEKYFQNQNVKFANFAALRESLIFYEFVNTDEGKWDSLKLLPFC